MAILPASAFGSLPIGEREAIIAFVSVRYGWDEYRALQEVDALDHVGLAYLKREMRGADGCGGHRVEHDPGAEMFNVR